MRFLLLALLLLTGCSGMPPLATGTMCDVAGTLSGARHLVERAVAEETAGNTAGAQQLAGHAAMLATRGHDLLQTIESGDVRRGETWQTLLVGYLHVGQAANALLAGDADSLRQELASARRRLQSTNTVLPAGCFTPIAG